jgi:hypothetical protein
VKLIFFLFYLKIKNDHSDDDINENAMTDEQMMVSEADDVQFIRTVK